MLIGFFRIAFSILLLVTFCPAYKFLASSFWRQASKVPGATMVVNYEARASPVSRPRRLITGTIQPDGSQTLPFVPVHSSTPTTPPMRIARALSASVDP
jgi:hypothetical protein